MVTFNKLLFIGLVESKKDKVDDFLIRNLWPNLDFDYAWVPSVGASGGLILIWNSAILNSVSISKGSRWICMDFFYQNSSYRHILIYASNVASERVLFWQELRLLLDVPMIIFLSGDFNEILRPEERLNCVGYSPSMLALNDFINSAEMIDLPIHGRRFTWKNSASRSRIDRCLVSAQAGLCWPNLSLSALPQGQSDHVPICFWSASSFDWGPRPFRSVDAWWEHENFSTFVSDSWSSICSTPDNLTQRLKKLRLLIKEWNNNVFGDQNKIIKDLNCTILAKELEAENRQLNEGEVNDLIANKNALWVAEKRMESLWIQKSRLNWSLSGDKNSKFFHSIASQHHRNNYISAILVEDVIYSEPTAMRFHIRDFFNSLYSCKERVPYDISDLGFRKLTTVQADCLIQKFDENEVFFAISSLNERKAPGPDGFNFFFYRRAWSIMKAEILDMFSTFHSSSSLPKGINTSFMVLIPKVIGSSNIKDFRPISLVNGLYKLLSKTLSLRLAPLLSSLVSESQHAFLKGRSILECSMIANELIHLANRRKEKLLVLKLDFQKAFDTIDWMYLLTVMRCMGFPQLWIDWMFYCLSSSTTSILVNGSPVEPITLQRGVRQGDPISPYLFVLAVQGLKCLLDKASNLGFTCGYSYSDNFDPVSLLQFADDTLIFIPYDVVHLQNLTWILRCFEVVSGLKINFHKSSIMGINTSVDELATAASVVGCKIESLPIKYLGLPLVRRQLASGFWDHVVDRFKSKLALWKGSLLSPAGRLVLIKSVLFSVPVYFMSVFSMPSGVQRKLESYMKRFLWKGDVASRTLCKVSWKSICQDYEMGGLGISSLRVRNQSLLFKWVWKLRFCCKNSLWFTVVASGSNISDWDSLLLGDNKKMSSIWKGIKKKCCGDEFVWKVFVGNIRYKIGDGALVSVWHDNWLEDGRLIELFPELFNLSNQKHAYLSDIRSFGWKWRRRLRGSELLLLRRFQILFNGLHFVDNRVDVIKWNASSSGFSAASFCKFVATAAANHVRNSGVDNNVHVAAAGGLSQSNRTAELIHALNRYDAAEDRLFATEVMQNPAAVVDFQVTAAAASQNHVVAAVLPNPTAAAVLQVTTSAADFHRSVAAAVSQNPAAAAVVSNPTAAAVLQDPAAINDHGSRASTADNQGKNNSAVQVNSSSFTQIWNSQAPPRVKFFIWVALHNRVPTLDFLARRLIIPTDNTMCSLCNVLESQDHLFIHCVFARNVWCGVLQKLDIAWVLPFSFEEFMFQWQAIVPRGPYWKLWEVLWCLVVWELWKCRNSRVFSNELSDKETVIFSCFTRSAFIYKC
ncbi:uncharacterized protein LOC126672753 [Mercurialis annua]|uniref:uncharacterized protein LOC126672753 n=1 Tax=Mercurialis annua TaxID=3986 RepID=UPI0021602C92|nr:uncharacterized protein LOC126672753 [Mercurialis annua]